MNSKKNAEFSIDYAQRIINYAVGTVSKIRVLKENWTGIIENSIKNSIIELSSTKVISEETMLSLQRK